MADSNGVSQKRYLYITVQEASGKSKDQEVLWEPSFTEGFVRVEVRGGAKTVKAITYNQSVQNLSITWEQELRVEVTDESKELRIMLCKEKPRDGSGSKRNTAILAACGIYVKDILESVPIDKYFELFKPGEGGDRALGGFIRVMLRTSSSNPGRPQTTQPVQKNSGISADVQAVVQSRLEEYEQTNAADEDGKGKRGYGRLLMVAGLAATAVVMKIVVSRKK